MHRIDKDSHLRKPKEHHISRGNSSFYEPHDQSVDPNCQRHYDRENRADPQGIIRGKYVTISKYQRIQSSTILETID